MRKNEKIAKKAIFDDVITRSCDQLKLNLSICLESPKHYLEYVMLKSDVALVVFSHEPVKVVMVVWVGYIRALARAPENNFFSQLILNPLTHYNKLKFQRASQTDVRKKSYGHLKIAHSLLAISRVRARELYIKS